MKKKVTIIGIAIGLFVLIISIKPIQNYYEQRKEQERLAQAPFFTEFELSHSEIFDMQSFFRVFSDPDYFGLLDNAEDWPDFTYCTMFATDETEMAVAVLNYDLFVKCDEWTQDAKQRAEAYGFSFDNPITVEWIMEHPRQAIGIVREMPNDGYEYRSAHQYRYEEIFGPLTEESTEVTEF